MTYQEYILTDEWRAKADAAKKRAGYRCQVCNSPDRLQAHHRTYDNLFNEKPMDLTVLCDPCHELFSKSGRLLTPASLLNWDYIKPKLMAFKDWIKKYQGVI
jgi:5-methylcytosine-specific restriction endonuclease McrA